jgi:hypothetical protein
MIPSYHNQIQCQTLNLTKNAVSAQFIRKNNIEVPIYYIHSLTKSQAKIFGYLFGFASASEIMLKISTIANKTKYSLITVRRALQRFHDERVILKYQKYSCYDVNNFEFGFKTLNKLNSKLLAENEHLNNINTSLSINSTTTILLTTTNYSNIKLTRAPERIHTWTLIHKKQKEAVMNNDIFEKFGLKMTTHGEVYFKYIPQVAVEFALDKFKKSAGIKSPARYICSEIREYVRANRLVIDWVSYFKEVTRVGVDKNTEVVEFNRIVEVVKQTTLSRKIEILTSDPDQKLKDKIKWHQDLMKDRRKELDDNANTSRSQYNLDKIEFHTKAIQQLKENISKDQQQRKIDMSDNITQAERDYRSLYSKMEKDALELNKWKSILDDATTQHSFFSMETIKMANVIIPRMTEQLTNDVYKLNGLDELRKENNPEIFPDMSHNFSSQEGLEQTEIH